MFFDRKRISDIYWIAAASFGFPASATDFPMSFLAVIGRMKRQRQPEVCCIAVGGRIPFVHFTQSGMGGPFLCGVGRQPARSCDVESGSAGVDVPNKSCAFCLLRVFRVHRLQYSTYSTYSGFSGLFTGLVLYATLRMSYTTKRAEIVQQSRC